MAHAGIYIHIPFCRRKCPYCDFYSLVPQEEMLDRYTARICDELQQFGREHSVTADTLYFGGGTPTLMGERLLRIADAAAKSFHLTASAEITVEANPVTADTALFSALRRGGINRLSLGAQSAHDDELQALGRLHTADDISRAVETARASGFANLSLDLMLATPGQTLDSLCGSIDFCASLGPEHLSSYLLKIEPGTDYAKRRDSLTLPDEDAQADFYLTACREMERHGYAQYEISNFARPGYESRHNCKYWELTDYIGFGPAAHSCFGGRRFYRPRDLQAYLSGADNIVDDGGVTLPDEHIFLGLRLTKGINIDELYKKYPDFADIRPFVAQLVRGGLARLQDGMLSLTPQGFLVSNEIFARML